MQITSRLKKSISQASLVALSSAALSASNIRTPDEALDRLTGPNQPNRGQTYDMCVSVTPYFLTSWDPRTPDEFISLQIDGVAQMANSAGQCNSPDEFGKCERGYIRITSTVPIQCYVPISL
jgi:hypothetical protein